MQNHFFRVLLIVLALACAGCGGTVPVSTDNQSAPLATPPVFSWRLPKTIFTVQATYTYQSCSLNSDAKPLVMASVAISVTPNYISDPNLGPLAPAGMVSLDVSKLESFWQDHQVEVKTFSDSNILQMISSTSTDQTGTIISNVVTSATKVAGMALGVPTGAGAQTHPDCGDAQKTKGNIDTDMKKLALLDPSTTTAKNLTARIQSEKASIQITISCSIDPGVATACADATLPINATPSPIKKNEVATLAPGKEQLAKANWYNSVANNQINNGLAPLNDLILHVILDFSNAMPMEVRNCPDGTTTCDRSYTKLTSGAFYRDVAYIPMEIYRGDINSPESTLYSSALAFAQFGVPRSIPMQAHMFGKSAWTLTFANSGELVDATYGSVAIGTAATSLFGSAASSASGIDAEKVKASQQVDSTTQAQQLENTKLQAIIQGATYKQQCLSLLAQGQVKSCD